MAGAEPLEIEGLFILAMTVLVLRTSRTLCIADAHHREDRHHRDSALDNVAQLVTQRVAVAATLMVAHFAAPLAVARSYHALLLSLD